MGESIQKWLGRNRPPRVRITYDVETGGAIEKRELPFVIGLFADLSGDCVGGALPAYALRSMETIDRDNFSDVLAAARPSVALGQVASTLAGDDPSARLTGALTFKSLEDFEPVAVVKAVPALNELYRTRGQIRMMQAAAESGDGLHKALEPLMKLDAAGRAARAPFRSLADPAQRAHLGDRLLSLRKLAMDIALAADDAAAVAAAQAYGFVTGTAETSPIDSARQFIGLFAADDTTDNRRAAAERMAALSSYARPDGEVGPAQRKSRAALAQALGLTSDDARQAIAAEATALSQRLAAAPPDDATPQQRAAQDDAVQAALLHLGILEAEDSDDIDSVNRRRGARVGVRALAKRQHLADSRWYANNLLINTGVVAPANAAPPAADAPAAAVPEMPAAPASTMQDVLRVLHLFDEAGLATHLDRRQFLPHLGAFAHDILARSTSRA